MIRKAVVVLLCAIVLGGAHEARAQVRNEHSSPAILVHTSKRLLELVTSDGRRLRYKVGVGRQGKQWFGTTRIVSKHLRPAWSPPADMRGGRAPFVIPAGAPNNPMGAAALVLADNELAIHGTNNSRSIGGMVSWGCVRMHNADVLDLFGRVSIGTPVTFLR